MFISCCSIYSWNQGQSREVMATLLMNMIHITRIQVGFKCEVPCFFYQMLIALMCKYSVMFKRLIQYM